MSLYVDKNTFVHHIDPMSKLYYVVASIAVSFILPNYPAIVTCLAVSLFLLIAGRIVKKTLPFFGYTSVVLITIILIQGLFYPENETPFISWGPVVFYEEGLHFAAIICLRVINILCAFSVLVLTTKPSHLVDELVRQGMSPKIGYVLSSVLQIIPQMTAMVHKITDAQRSRGMETEGNLWVRLKAFIPLIAPVVMRSLMQTQQRATALEVRGFDSGIPRTFFNERHTHPASIYIRIGLVGAVIFAILWRIFA